MLETPAAEPLEMDVGEVKGVLGAGAVGDDIVLMLDLLGLGDSDDPAES